MKKIILTAITCIFILCSTIGVTRATIIGSLWDGIAANANTAASYLTANSGDITTTLGNPSDTFTVSQLNFFSGAGPHNTTYQEFLGGTSNINDLTWLIGIHQTDTISTEGNTAAFFQFTGTAYFENGANITHDDGAFVQLLKDDVVQYTFDFSKPSQPKLDYFNGVTPGTYDFVVNYSAWNGNPEVLKTAGVFPVPEPTTMLLFGTGLFGLAGIKLRKK